jgi:hypothetical protein
MATYEEITIYVKEKYNVNIKPCYIAHVKEIVGLKPKIAPNRISNNSRKYPCPESKINLIKDAFKYFNMI